MTFSRSFLPLMAALAVLAGSCTGSGSTDATAPDSAADGVVGETTASTTASADETTTSADTTTTIETDPDPTPPESMPGDIIEFGPAAGDELAVVGVAFDDELNVRIAPGTEFDVIDSLAHDATDLIANGENRLLADSFWVEIQSGDGVGWVNEAFIGFIGVSRAIDFDPGPYEGTAADAGLAFAETVASQEPPSRITLHADGDEVVIVDVMGLGDDAVKGMRLTITTDPASDGIRTITAVQETAICGRGLTTDGLCV